MATNFSLTVEKSSNSLTATSPPWVKLSLPDCITIESRKSLQILDLTANDQTVQIKKHGPHDYVFQLKEGVNFLRLLNLVNPTEQCLWKANRLSFEYRSYEDEQLVYQLEERTTGLVPSLSCQSPCASCRNVNKQFCLSCIDPKNMLLLKPIGF